ncbi:FtsK/SpoIIIE domain-containing protein [Embleya sp. AB8]|uniref:FtsK/SpoIIIE domain-containing protein n=1 Tax=Embleya sp. AB8 TaxID=3156304 RepID=UPI003C7735F4
MEIQLTVVMADPEAREGSGDAGDRSGWGTTAARGATAATAAWGTGCEGDAAQGGVAAAPGGDDGWRTRAAWGDGTQAAGSGEARSEAVGRGGLKGVTGDGGEARGGLAGVAGAASVRADLLVEVDGAASVGDLARELERVLGRTSSGDRPSALYVAGHRVAADLAVESSPLRDGVVVGLGSPAGCAPARAQGSAEVHATGGPDAGGVHRLGPGVAVLGSAPDAWIRAADPVLPPAAVEVDVALDGEVAVRAATEGIDGLTLDGEPLDTTWRPWPIGAVLAAGHSTFERTVPGFPDAALSPTAGGGGLDFNRPPRLRPPPRRRRFQIPARPEQGDPQPLPWMMALTPVVGAVVMTYMMHNTRMLYLAALSPLSMLAMYVTNRRHGRSSYRRRLAEYRLRKESIEAQAAYAMRVETRQRRQSAPDPAALGLIAGGPRQRLWERRRADEDRLSLRVGTGELPTDVEVMDPRREEHRRDDRKLLAHVPVCVPLAECGVLGVAGRARTTRALGRWLVAQAAALHAPSDLTICVLTDQAAGGDWEWVRWLPHATPPDAGHAVTFIGADADTIGRRIAELLALMTARQDAAGQPSSQTSSKPLSQTPSKTFSQSSSQTFSQTSSSDAEPAHPAVLIVLDGSRRLRALPGVTQLLRSGPAVGLYAICLDTDRRTLPQECAAVVEEDGQGLFQVSRTGAETVREVRPDGVDPSWAEELARALAPLRDTREEDDATVPDSSRLLDVLDLEPPTPELIAARWTLGGRSTQVVIGEAFDGAFAVDLVRDGPHGLVAGTTGSGKSELLQTIVASLAVANRPDAMTFALVDFKGGAAFKDCVHLPHTVGMVTDLEARLVERALDSLAAELKRREHILADAGTKDLEDYLVAMRRDPTLTPLPRLLIVIDEFAEMAHQMGEAVTTLVNIARRGRSLGIHMLLATQRPGGAVSPEIRANTNLRIALRVTDTAESADVIDAPDAGRIAKSTPGRAYVRLGAASLLPFQSARVGGRRNPTESTGDRPLDAIPAPRALPIGWTDLGRPVPRPAGTTRESDDLVTDLGVLVEAIRAANERLGIPPQHSPWAPPLADSLTLAELESESEAGGGESGRSVVSAASAASAALAASTAASAADGLVPAPYAIEDLPHEQRRRVRTVDLATFGHLLAAGAPRTGRSQLLRTIAGSLARHNSTADVHLYGLDCGNGALLALTELPHCGAVVRSTDTERAIRLIGKFTDEIRRRMALLGEHGYTDIAEQRAAAGAGAGVGAMAAGVMAAGVMAAGAGAGASAGAGAAGGPLPHLVLFLDRWEGFSATLGAANHGEITDTLLQMIREGASVGVHLVISGDRTLLTGRISSLTENRLTLQLADRGDYSLIGLSPRKAPETMPPGRGYGPGVVETQVALLGPDPTGQGQAGELREIGRAAATRDAEVPRGQRPFRVDVLPASVDFETAWALRVPGHGPMWAMAGVGGDQLTALGPDLAGGTPAFVVAGPARSGRSTALLALARSYLDVGTELVVLAPRESPLRGLAGRPGVREVFASPHVDADDFRTVLDKLTGPAVVIADDAELLRDCDAGADLLLLVRRSLRPELGLVVGGDADGVCAGFSGWQVEAKKAKRGLLLSPQNLVDGELVGAKLPRALVGQPVLPGRGVLHLGGGELTAIQVPVP